MRAEKSPRRDIVLMNAAAALVAAGRADSLHDAMPLAVQWIDTGAANPNWTRWWSLRTGVMCSSRDLQSFEPLRSPMPLSLSRRAARTVQSEIRAMSIACEKVQGIDLAQVSCEVPPVREGAKLAVRPGHRQLYPR